MQITIPFIEIILFITSIFAPAEMNEFDLTIEGQTVHLQQTEKNKWEFTQDEIGTVGYTQQKNLIITEFKSKNLKREFNMRDYLTLPIDENKNRLTLKNGMVINVKREEQKITYNLLSDDNSHETFVVSWKKTETEPADTDNPGNPPGNFKNQMAD